MKIPATVQNVPRIGEIFARCRRAAFKIVSPAYRATLDFIYPPACLFCGEETIGDDAGICEACLVSLKPRHANECPRCGAPVGQYVDLSNGCGQCHREKFTFDRVIRLGIYDGEMRKACLRAKANGGTNVARSLAAALVHEKRIAFEEFQFDFVLPIPEHWTRRFFHSHYAAETVSREVAQRLNLRWKRDILTKLRRTPKQATSPTPLRREQQRGSFGIRHSNLIAGKTILLVDDIFTTGSTVGAAAQALKQAGAKRVIVTVLAVSPLRQ